eukprot:CAMPEP_0172309080 /NCGR_PEP_ID=MMETSP1058-20130122/9478_1 /TAXON_ID=83371 /ORGANISM="Detonula confervacea, Strain CCMP 353" /LENGTH=394 /DNA_ID=CAMNT_0013021633 /DNA_START=187 /DNA_END=1371 /DNA_ORIENTATION=-
MPPLVYLCTPSMTFLIPYCLAALLLARPADGLIAFRRPSVAREGGLLLANSRSSSSGNPPRKCYTQKRALCCLGLQNNNDGDGDDFEEAGQREQVKSQPSVIASSNNNNKNNDPSLAQIMSLMGTSPRRVFLSLASSTTIALAANLFGVTSNILSALPEEAVEKSGLDSYYPRGDYKRMTVRGAAGTTISNNGIATSNNSGKCSFLIPKEWVADTSLALAQAQRQARTLDYTMNSSDQRQQQQKQQTLPDAAYGPPGKLDSRGLSNGDTNVSVIINNGVQNFSLASALGADPTSAAEVLLSSKFGSRRPVKLVSAFEERRGGDGDGNNSVPVYQFEYTVDRGEKAKPLRAISVVAGSLAGDAFVTLTIVSPEEDWEKPLVDERLRQVAKSFKLV